MLVKLFHYLFACAPIALVVRSKAGLGAGLRAEPFEAAVGCGVRAPITLDDAISTRELREHVRPASEFGELEIPQEKSRHRAERGARCLWIDIVLEIRVPPEQFCRGHGARYAVALPAIRSKNRCRFDRSTIFKALDRDRDIECVCEAREV